MISKEVTSIWLGGEGGEGVVSTGEILSNALLKMGYQVFSIRTYPAEIKGGLAIYHFSYGKKTIQSIGNNLTIAVCLNEEAVDECKDEINETTTLLLEKNLNCVNQFPNHKSIEIPFQELTKKITTQNMMKSSVVVGYLAHYLGIKKDVALQTLLSKFSGKKRNEEIQLKNQTAFESGWNNFENLSNEPNESNTKKSDTILLSGNQSMAMGALLANCKYVAGYPITPATPLLEFLARELPKSHGVFIQTEDEMAALASCLGASFAGKRAMTATSGPGFALMSELLNLAVMAELPVVIVNVQRAGPSTGMPTKTEQSDLLYALFGSPGESPRVVIAPGNVTEAFQLIQVAFQAADLVQGPVIVLSDQSLGYRLETMNKEMLVEHHSVTLLDSSSRSIPGTTDEPILLTGLEHNGKGQPDYSPRNHSVNSDLRQSKLERIKQLPEWNLGVEDVGIEKGIGLVGWGSTLGVIRDAKSILSEKLNQPIGHFHFRWLNPFPIIEFQNWVQKFSQVYFIEENYSGQLRFLANANVPVQSKLINKITGLPFTEKEIIEPIVSDQEKQIDKRQTVLLQSR